MNEVLLPEVKEDIRIEEKPSHKLLVFNDDINTFDWVIEVLVKVCGHTPQQAEQCTLIIHYSGKCSVKEGEWDDLVPMRQAICKAGIWAEVV